MSTINTNGLNTNYPVPGVNNSTQGFRDNFINIKNNLDTAGTEITDIQSKAIVKSALTGTVLDNNMANTLITNACVQGFRSKTYNLGENLSGSVVINVTKADIQYGTIQGNVSLSFGGWPPSGTLASVELQLTIASPTAGLVLPTTTVSSGEVVSGMKDSVKLIENYFATGNAAVYTNNVTVPNGVNQLILKFTTIDCGVTLDVEPVNRNQRATQLEIRTPTAVGLPGDFPGQICMDQSGFLYVCVGVYDGSTAIWGKVALSSV
jgi:hypothetical protein